MDMLERMQEGRLKVATHLRDFYEEKGVYHRKDGRIVDTNDDVISAVRYAVLSLRHARTQGRSTQPVVSTSHGARLYR